MEHIIKNKNQIVSLYSAMYTTLFEFGCRLTGDHRLVEDCIHDLFETLINKDDFSDILSWDFYLKRALKNMLSKKLERQKMPDSTDETQYKFQIERSDEDIMIEKEEMKLVKAKVHKAIESLSERHKEVIILRFFKKLTYDEIGIFLGIKSKTVRNHIHNAYSEFRHIYSSL